MGAGGHAGAAGVAGMAGSSGSAGRGGSGGGSGDGGGGAGGDPDPCEAAMLAEDKCPVCDDDASCDAATYTDNGDQTVSSSCCDLVWQQVVDAAQFDHEDAAAYCTGLGMAGGGWRLPTKDELLSLIAEGNMPPIDPVAFPNTEQGVFWSSTLVRNSPNNAWSVGFLDAGGYAQPSTRATTSKVRCVR